VLSDSLHSSEDETFAVPITLARLSILGSKNAQSIKLIPTKAITEQHTMKISLFRVDAIIFPPVCVSKFSTRVDIV